jgi:hypothetical protein
MSGPAGLALVLGAIGVLVALIIVFVANPVIRECEAKGGVLIRGGICLDQKAVLGDKP